MTASARLLIVGPQGSGKGTQGVRIAESYGIPVVSTGDIFRANIKEGTALGQQVTAILDKGDLVPDELTSEIVRDRLSQDIEAVRVEEGCIGVARQERRMAQNVDQQIAIGLQAVNGGVLQCFRQQSRRSVPCRGEGDHLGEHGVVLRSHHAARLDAGIDSDVSSFVGHLELRTGDLESVHGTALRLPVLSRILGVQPNLDRVSPCRGLFGR